MKDIAKSTTQFPGGSDGKASAYNAGDPGSIPGLGRSAGEGNGDPLQYYCLESPMDRGYSPWGRKESDTTEGLHLLTYHSVTVQSPLPIPQSYHKSIYHVCSSQMTVSNSRLLFLPQGLFICLSSYWGSLLPPLLPSYTSTDWSPTSPEGSNSNTNYSWVSCFTSWRWIFHVLQTQDHSLPLTEVTSNCLVV